MWSHKLSCQIFNFLADLRFLPFFQLLLDFLFFQSQNFKLPFLCVVGPSSQHWLQKRFVFMNQDLRCLPIVPLRLNRESNIFVHFFLLVDERGMQLLYFFPFLEVNQHFGLESENQKVEHDSFQHWQLLSIEEWLRLNAVEVIPFRLWTLLCNIVRRATETNAWL